VNAAVCSEQRAVLLFYWPRPCNVFLRWCRGFRRLAADDGAAALRTVPAGVGTDHIHPADRAGPQGHR